MKVVTVRWIDSHTDNGWTDVEAAVRQADEKSAMLMETTGYLVADELGYVLIAGTFSAPLPGESTLVNGTMQIPRACIVGEMAELRPFLTFSDAL